MTSIPFVKASGCGNDFLLIERRLVGGLDLAAATVKLCDRHNGVGADGVEWLGPAGLDFNIDAHLINADGSAAEISGNGTRCVAAYFASAHLREVVRVRTGAGIKECRLVEQTPPSFRFDIAMGMPGIEGEFEVAGHKGRGISFGNPHFVVLVKDFDFDWQRAGEAIQESGRFAAGVNVEFVRTRSETTLEARFYERGAGATRSSGTGSCASAVASVLSGDARSPVKVIAQGGEQTVSWGGEGSPVFLEGPATLVCKGEAFL